MTTHLGAEGKAIALHVSGACSGVFEIPCLCKVPELSTGLLPAIVFQNDVILVSRFVVSLFLCINFLLITTFFMKEFFYTTMRYILFANTLLSDCLILIVTNFLLIFDYFHLTMQIWLCLIFYILSSVYTFVTPVTLTAMTLERYVAICMPLQHSELCSTHRSLHCILIIHSLSYVPCIVILSVFFASASLSFYKQYKVCSVEMFIFHSWQRHLRSAISLFYFLIMFIAIVFSYVKIMKVAKAASGENKKSTVLKCLSQYLQNLMLLHYYFTISEDSFLQSGALQTTNTIFGLRDEKFFNALKNFALCGLHKNLKP
ncbi:odorant receptor 131-2-like [Morone saxatilis]|uniref:odorant receptor 131-2-like n=1 Tax=Morone saxatilis TaxID=34816 RepID=UPI0015E23244|nr:odorant receptor 131-2-like [Morone saxatilis]